jgi:hypothetical protein
LWPCLQWAIWHLKELRWTRGNQIRIFKCQIVCISILLSSQNMKIIKCVYKGSEQDVTILKTITSNTTVWSNKQAEMPIFS